MDDVDQFLRSLTLDEDGLAQQWMSLSSIVTILVALAFGFLILLVYERTTRRENRDQTLFTVIPVLTILMAVIMRIEGVQIVLFFGIFGILSIVRFRSELTDQKGITFILFAVILGVLVGVGNYVLAFFAWALVAGAILAARRLFRPRTTFRLTVEAKVPVAEAQARIEAWLDEQRLSWRAVSFQFDSTWSTKTQQWLPSRKVAYLVTADSPRMAALEGPLLETFQGWGFETELRPAADGA